MKRTSAHPMQSGRQFASCAQGGKTHALSDATLLGLFGALVGKHGLGLRFLAGGLGGRAEVVRQRLDFGVPGIALTVLDAQNGVIGNTTFLGDHAKVTDAALKGGAHVFEKVFSFHGSQNKAFLPCSSRRFCFFCRALRGRT